MPTPRAELIRLLADVDQVVSQGRETLTEDLSPGEREIAEYLHATNLESRERAESLLRKAT